MKKSCTLLLASMLVLSSQVGMAAVKAGEVTLSPMIGGIVYDMKNGIDRNAVVGGLRAGYNVTKTIGVEALFDYSNTQTRDFTNNKDVKMYRYGAEALYNFFPDAALVPHVAAGIGALNFNGEGLSSRAKTMLDWGVGAKYFLTDNVALRGDVRHIATKDDRWKNDLEYMVGLYIPFGGTKAVAKAVEPEPAPVAKAPVAKPVVAPVVEPAPVAKPVEAKPAPVVESAKRVEAAKRFCNKPAVIEILFDFDKATIKPSFHDELKTVGDFLKEFPESKGAIEGYTDSVGNKKYNEKLSTRRAESVRNYIVTTFGIKADRLSFKGYGEAKPVADNKSKAGRAKNRRTVTNFSCE